MIQMSPSSITLDGTEEAKVSMDTSHLKSPGSNIALNSSQSGRAQEMESKLIIQAYSSIPNNFQSGTFQPEITSSNHLRMKRIQTDQHRVLELFPAKPNLNGGKMRWRLKSSWTTKSSGPRLQLETTTSKTERRIFNNYKVNLILGKHFHYS